MEKIAFFLNTKKLTDSSIRGILKKIPETRQEVFYSEKKKNPEIKYFDLQRGDFDEFVKKLKDGLQHLKGKIFWSFLMDFKGSVRVWAV